MTNEQKTLALRLSEAFPAVNWTADEELEFDMAACWLEITTEEVETLVVAGVLRASPAPQVGRFNVPQIKLADILTLIEETDWLERRAAVQLAYLKSEIERLRAVAALERVRVAKNNESAAAVAA